MEPATTERTLWQGSPSQAVNLPYYIILGVGAIVGTVLLLFLKGGLAGGAGASVVNWLIAAAWVACGLIAVQRYLRLRSTKYLLTSERLRITTGVLSTTTEDIELRRVRDSSVVRPFFLRLLGLGDVHIVSTDQSAPRVTLRAIRNPDAVQTQIRSIAQDLFTRRMVREIDVT